MPNMTFGDLLSLVLTELSATLNQTDDKAQMARVHVQDVELEIPAMLNLISEPTDATATPSTGHTSQLIVAMPAPRETFPMGRVGRIRMKIEADRKPREVKEATEETQL